MFGAFRPTNVMSGGLLWKIPWRLSKFQKARQRKRLRAVDTVVATVDRALAAQGITTKAVERWKEEMPTEQEMLPRDKYTMFDRKEKKYRKGIHSKLERCATVDEKRLLISLQNYPNGRDYHNDSILPVIDMEILGWAQWKGFSPEDLVYNMH
ncbi:hypothetical protein NHQ30_010310 [Ciborinia camelliae]|nr:hypothetical protein NHQ30_010310 [Ciborinia camelliae]